MRASRKALAMLGQVLVVVLGAFWLVRTNNGLVDLVMPVLLLTPVAVYAHDRHKRGLTLELPGAFLAAFAGVILVLYGSILLLTGLPSAPSALGSFALVVSLPLGLLTYGLWKMRQQRQRVPAPAAPHSPRARAGGGAKAMS
jgi:hypothetical protein